MGIGTSTGFDTGGCGILTYINSGEIVPLIPSFTPLMKIFCDVNVRYIFQPKKICDDELFGDRYWNFKLRTNLYFIGLL